MTSRYIKTQSSQLHYVHFHTNHFSCKIYPNLGASIQELIIDGVKIIDGISPDSEGLIDYQSTYKSSILFPFPNRIKSGTYTFEEEQYQLPINEKVLDNALHGLVYNQSFEVPNLTDNSVELVLESQGFEGYPFAFELRLSYLVTPSQITLTYQIQNKSQQNIPFAFGWHPYFATNDIDQSQLLLSADKMMITDARNIPTNNQPWKQHNITFLKKEWDDGFRLVTPAFQWQTPDYTITFDVDQHHYLQLYTPPHRQSVAIEPMTAPANSFNSQEGLQTLAPNAIYQGKITLQYKII